MNRPRLPARLVGVLEDPVVLRIFHGWMAVLWVVLGYPTIVWWKESILWVSFMSLWANVASHWASWQSSRVEVKQDEAAA